MSISQEIADINEFRKTSEKRIVTKVRFKLKVTFTDGTIICHSNVKNTFEDAILHVGVDNVYQLGLLVKGCKLLSKKTDLIPEKWVKHMKSNPLPNGMFLFTNTDTDSKFKQLCEISDKLGNPYKVEYVEG